MATKVTAEPIYIGNDHIVKIEHITDQDGAELDTTSWVSVTWTLRVKDRSEDTVIEKPSTRSGSYSATPASNTQCWTAVLTDDETSELEQGTYRFAWKRMDAGAEQDLAYGNQPVIRTASR